MPKTRRLHGRCEAIRVHRHNCSMGVRSAGFSLGEGAGAGLCQYLLPYVTAQK